MLVALERDGIAGAAPCAGHGTKVPVMPDRAAREESCVSATQSARPRPAVRSSPADGTIPPADRVT